MVLGVGVNGLLAQETLVSDALPTVFEGSVHYRLTYAGGIGQQQGLLPDSMVVTVQGGALRTTFFGGVSDSLLREFLWLPDRDSLFVLDGKGKVAFVQSESDAKQLVRAELVSKAEVSEVLGLEVQGYVLTEGQQKEYMYFSDSIYFDFEAADSLSGVRPPFMAAGIHSIPLWSRRRVQGVTHLAVAVEIRPLSGAEAPIELPEGYTIRPFFPMPVRHPSISKH